MFCLRQNITIKIYSNISITKNRDSDSDKNILNYIIFI